MSRYNCAFCSPCKDLGLNYCDKCTASCCLENITNHNEIFEYGDRFKNIINNAQNDLYNKSSSISNYLSNNCDIDINLHCNSIDCNEDFLMKMKKKKNEIKNQINYLENQIKKVNENHNMKIKQLNMDHVEKIKICDASFENEKSKYKNEDDDRELKEKKEEKKQLENYNKIHNQNKNEIINNFMNEQQSIAEQDFSNKKNQIEQKYKYEKVKLEYTEKEIKMKNDYLNEIQNLKLYSDKIPNFFNIIAGFGLNKFIN